jgi:hypothetical protein
MGMGESKMPNESVPGTGTPPPAAGNPPPAAGNPPPGNPPPGAPPAGAPGWYAELPEDVRGYVELKGFKEPKALAESYRNLEKLHSGGPEKLLRIPDKADAPEWKDIYKRLGAPEKADGYEVKVPEGFSSEFADWARGKFLELGLTKGQGDKLAASWNERILAMNGEMTKSQQDSQAQQLTALKTEWGQAFDQNVRVAQSIAKVMGLKDDHLKAIANTVGVDTLNKALVAIKDKFKLEFNEDTFVDGLPDGNNFGGAMSPGAAKARIAEIMADKELAKKYVDGDRSIKNEMDRLHRWAFGG